jgi:hypothetical protein
VFERNDSRQKKENSVEEKASVDVDPALSRVPEVEVGFFDQHRTVCA